MSFSYLRLELFRLRDEELERVAQTLQDDLCKSLRTIVCRYAEGEALREPCERIGKLCAGLVEQIRAAKSSDELVRNKLGELALLRFCGEVERIAVAVQQEARDAFYEGCSDTVTDDTAENNTAYSNVGGDIRSRLPSLECAAAWELHEFFTLPERMLDFIRSKRPTDLPRVKVPPQQTLRFFRNCAEEEMYNLIDKLPMDDPIKRMCMLTCSLARLANKDQLSATSSYTSTSVERKCQNAVRSAVEHYRAAAGTAAGAGDAV
jgi:hypothetical protein